MLNLYGLTWRKSSYSSAGGECVEAALLVDGRVALRDSKDPEGGILLLSPAAMISWLGAIKAGVFDTDAG